LIQVAAVANLEAVLKEVLVLLALGLAVGIPAAIGLGRFVATRLYDIKAIRGLAEQAC